MNEIPNEYEVHPNLTENDLKKFGFKERLDYYQFKKQLDKFFQLTINISIDDTGKYMNSIVTDDGSIYAPFYNIDMRHDNLVYDEVVHKVNSFMDGLVKKQILIYKKPRLKKRTIKK